MIIVWLAPFFMVFEVAQVIAAERFIGIKQIRARLHPLEVQPSGPLRLSIVWVTLLLADYAYQVLLLFPPNPIRLAAAIMIFVSVAGFGLRRAGSMKWGLVVLTFECALRIGFLWFVFSDQVLHPSWHRWPGMSGH